MKINSEKLWDYIFNLATDEKVRFKVFYDDNYVTEVLWDGENFVWNAGTFTSGAFFNPLYEFEVIEEEKKEIEKLDVALLGQCDNWLRCPTNEVTKQDIELNPYIINNIRENTLYFQRKINELIDIVNKLNKE